MSQYCSQPQCVATLNPIEMKLEYSGLRYSIYRCPRCQRTRKVKLNLISMPEVKDVSFDEAQKTVKKGKLKLIGLGALAGIALLIGILSSSRSKKTKRINSFLELKDD